LSTRLTAILQAVFVTFLWSTSWVLIKIGLRNDLPAITFAGLRYALAWLCLVPFVLLRAEHRAALKKLGRGEWISLALLGVFTYAITQSLQYLGLAFLPAAMLSLLLNLTSAFVAFGGVWWLHEQPSTLQWIGLVLTVAGVLLYFLPIQLPRAQVIGIVIALGCMFGNVIASLLGRNVNRSAVHSPLLVTFVSMGVGSALMLGFGATVQGFGSLNWTDWFIIAWLALVNTAFAFTLWNKTLRTLTAIESSVINSLMMPQIAILALVFLGEKLTIKEIFGLVLVGLGVLIVQLQRRRNG
jgi:drug/metabolite transporter (DMT)-like permease